MKHDTKKCEICQRLFKQYIEVTMALIQHSKDVKKDEVQ